MHDIVVIEFFEEHKDPFPDYLEREILIKNNIDFRLTPQTAISYDGVTGTITDEKTQEHQQFVHTIYHRATAEKSGWFYLVDNILQILHEKMDATIIEVERQKINITTPQPNYPEGFYAGPHVDMAFDGDNWYSLIYYINDSDGDTYFFNEYHPTVEGFDKKELDGLDSPKELTLKCKIKPKKGTAVIFPSNLFHSSSPPKETAMRGVINFVFKTDKEIKWK